MEKFLWEEKYRPKTIDECILPQSLKDAFKGMIANGNITNMTFAGRPGVGKTTVAIALCNEIGADYLIVQASKDRNIDTLRNEIEPFASAKSFSGGRKYVIFDEADYLNPQSTQPALRNFMNEFADNCGFIFTCNYPNKLIEPLRDSRAPVINFKMPKSLAKEVYQNINRILKLEGVEIEPKILAEFVKKHFPDQRKMLNILQREASKGNVDVGLLAVTSDENFDLLLGYMKAKDFTSVRKWVGENSDLEDEQLFRHFYDNCSTSFTPSSIPALVLLIGRYQYQSSFVADKEINTAAFLAETMINCEIK
jgi:DNA polymerase III delta prime subunit